ncbi:MAG: family 10 glycosylhydrolase [Marinilabiliales bacterium]|nr:family 10 glycosylhydrolase [Marinilabiliales bacterium]
MKNINSLQIRKYLVLPLILFCYSGIYPTLSAKEYPKREMRAAWIATVENIDWPSSARLSTEEQKAEMVSLLDSVMAYHLNTVVFQVRPDADALYYSDLEPWSEWLTGKQGKAPDPFYDPLTFAIGECRKRGLDIHVWLNPYRAIQNTDKTVPAPNHVANTHPEWMLTYGKKRYFDPGLPAVRNHVARVVSDLVRRYDIDAIHFDDYFYPYKIAGLEFPDDNSFRQFPQGFGATEKEAWRRNNVDLIIKQLHDSIRAIRPSVEFGISPFGVWRNKKDDPEGSATRAGATNYDDLYADILKWQKEKWIDYVTPQLYWYIGKEVADYAILAKWWADHSYGCPVYIGQALYLLDEQSKDPSWRSAAEIDRQITLNRTIPAIRGSMLYSAKFLRKNPLGVKELLLNGHFKYPALTPENPHILPVAPGEPSNALAKKEGHDIVLSWEGSENATLYVVYRFKWLQRKKIDNPSNILYVTSGQKLLLKAGKGYKPGRYSYFVSALSPTHTESAAIRLKKQ